MSAARRFFLKFGILAAMLLGLPLIGVVLTKEPITRYLTFPPTTQYVRHAPFSWIAFFAYAVAILAVVLPLIIIGRRTHQKNKGVSTTVFKTHRFPWWGWIGVLTGASAWILAWTRISWFADFQPHTFSLLWFSYIVVVNGLCFRRTGHCMLTDRTGFFLLLFPASAAFWWFFEYLNRFVQNWYYTGTEYGPWTYFWLATLPFSTVLPAVLGTRDFILSFNWVEQSFGRFMAFKRPQPGIKRVSWVVLWLSAAGLTGIGVWPNYLFPLLWVSPLLIVVCLQQLFNERHVLSDMADGNWSGAVAAALAAVVCGWFWEMWNYFALAKWVYSIPFVHRFQIFEMPVLGYAGYLPFGLECAVIGTMIEALSTSMRGQGDRRS